MSISVHRLHDIVAKWDKNPLSIGLELRLQFADIVMRGLDKKGWTNKQLAEACDLGQTYIGMIVHADANCTFETAGRILFALGVKPELRAAKAKDAT